MNPHRTSLPLAVALTLVASAGISRSALAEPGARDDGSPDGLPVAATTYSELRVGVGGGGTTSGKNAEYDEEGVVAFNAAFLQRYDTTLFGVNLALGETLFGATHTYVGAAIGAVFGGPEAHIELIGEGGLHVITNLGDDLFDSGRGNTTAGMPYLGGQVRTVFDVGDPNGVQLELSVHARSDLTRDQRDIMVSGGLFSDETSRETWDLGGLTANAIAGLSYQFP